MLKGVLFLSQNGCMLHKPETLTTLGRRNCKRHKQYNIRHLSLMRDGQYFQARHGQGHRLFHKETSNRVATFVRSGYQTVQEVMWVLVAILTVQPSKIKYNWMDGNKNIYCGKGPGSFQI